MYSVVVTMFLTAKSNPFIFVPNCIKVVQLVKFPQAVYKISSS